mgnify:CR=1 FL=1
MRPDVVVQLGGREADVPVRELVLDAAVPKDRRAPELFHHLLLWQRRGAHLADLHLFFIL